MAENKTLPTQQAVNDFLAQVADEQQRNDCYQIAEMMQKITGAEPVMWGSNIVGFDSYHYRYDSGREGDSCLVGFAPRKGKLSIYLGAGFLEVATILERLGKYKNGVSCLNINKLADVDVAVLEELIRTGAEKMRALYPNKMAAK